MHKFFILFIIPLLHTFLFAKETDFIVSKDWIINCKKTSETKKCSITQSVDKINKQNEGERLLQLSFNQMKDNEYYMTMLLPLGMDLLHGVKFSIFGKSFGERLYEYEYLSCFDEGCVVHTKVNRHFLNKMELGKEAHLIFKLFNNNQIVKLRVSLFGFQEAKKYL